MNYIAERAQLRQSQLVGLIEEACQHLEPSAYQRDLAKQRYEGVGDWLARSDDWLLASIAIRLQGSVAIGTTVKPIGANEHDVDSGRARSGSRSRDLAGAAQAADRRPAPEQRQLRSAAGRDAAVLAPRLRQRIPPRHHAVDPQSGMPLRRRTRSRTRR